MKKVFFALTFFIFIVLSTNILKCQGNPCYPDCFGSQWIGPIGVNVWLDNCNAEVRVYYWYRFACNQWFDYYIDYVSLGDAADCFNDYYGGDLNWMLRDITEGLITLNPANFPPSEEGKCELNWRVMKGSCWRPSIIPHVPKIQKKEENEKNKILEIVYDVLIPCDEEYCCLEYYQVCINNGVRVITQTGYLPPEDPECINLENCIPVCGSVYRNN